MDVKQVPKWLEIALLELGVKEIKGQSHNPRILEYHDTTTLHATSDEVPWCSSFVNWCITKAGLIGTNSAAARSWEKYGERLKSPVLGCIVVMSRGDDPRSGHVGFYIESVNHGKHINVLGGNQSDTVKLETFPVSRVIAYIWPWPEKEQFKKKTFGSKLK